MGEEQATADRAQAHQQRSELQQRITDWLDIPLTVLAFGMLGLLTLELTVDLSPAWSHRISQAQMAIWAIFLAAFLIELALAPSKLDYLKKNWLTTISVALPALRTVRVLRVARALRGMSLVRIFTTLNRGTRALEHIVRRGQLGYVLALTLLVTITAAAGIFYFERSEPDTSIQTPGDALWWAATMVTTINSSLEAVTIEGRVIALLLRVFALAISGYLTAIIAVYLLGAPGRAEQSETEREELHQLRLEIARLESLIEGKIPQALRETDGRERVA